MKNTTYFSRQHIFRWLLLCWLLVPWGLQAQSSTHVTWDSQVGCQVYRGEKGNGDNSVAAATVETGTCIRVCENTNVTYTVHGSNILNVQWTSAGGTVQSVSGTANTEAVIAWGAAGGGFVHAAIQFLDGTTENQNICIEKINKPIPNFTVLNMKDRVCKNTEVHFQNLSQANGGSDIINYFWDFGDGTTSTAFEPTHTYTSAAGLTVSLTVTNKCGCSETTYQKLEILEAPPVQINCASVVCEGSVEKYSVQNGCKGDWKVIGGTLLNNYGNEIEVKWDHVDPTDGFGYVMYKSECGCPEWTTVKIPVILKAANIKGQDVVCTGKQYTYSLPQWPTTSFDWDVTGPGVGELTYNQQRNEILFKATVPGTYTLTSKYSNTLMLCGGEAVKTIVVEEPVTITGGSPEVCVGTSQTFTVASGVPSIWKVTLGNTVVNPPAPPSTSFTYNFAVAGSYMITAVRTGGGCESNAIMTKVIPPPAPPKGSIAGDLIVCAGRPYVYTLSGTIPPGVIPVWTVTNGVIQGSNAGQSVTVVFNSGFTSFAVSVAYRTAGPAGCLSPAITKKVTLVDLEKITLVKNTGPFCPSSIQKFSANLNGIVPDSMEWSFDDPNFGSFSSGQGTDNVVVGINEISGGISETNLKLTVIKCGKKKVLIMKVRKLVLPVINFTNVGNICLGSNLQFTIDQGSITSATGVTFTFANNSTHPATFDSSGVYTFSNNGYIQNNTGGNISQQVTVSYTGTNGCNYKPTVTANFIVLPETIITVSPVYNLEVCDDYPLQPYVLTANSSTGLTNIVEWQWFRNGAPLAGFNTNSYTLSGTGLAGTYQVRAKDINNCYVYSQEIKVNNSCPTGNNCTTPPVVYFAPQWTGCNTISVDSFSVNNPPNEIQWLSNDVLTLVSGQGTTTPVFQTDLAGAHIVSVRLRYGTCWYSASFEVRKNYEPKFNIAQTCSGNGYNVALYNTSTIFGIDPNSIVYTFSAPGLPTQTGQTANYNNLAPGTYTFTMTMSVPWSLYPPCTITKTITLAPVPNPNFLIADTACKGEVLGLTPMTYVPGNTYTWYFDGTSFITTQQYASVTFNTAGPKTIKLEVKTPQGCVYTSGTANILIKEANFNGTIVPGNAVACAGNPPAIVFTPSAGSAVPSGYIWMNGSQQVSGAPNSATFVPLQSGSYWPVLISADGCRTNAMSFIPAAVTLKTAPYVNISGQSNVCLGSSATLNGIVTDNTLEYQWKKNGTAVTGWNNTFPIVFNTGLLTTAGTYTFTLEVRVPGAAGCTSSKNFIITVSNPPTAPTVTYTQIGCQPYKIQLTASGPANGEYNWSNGMTGQSIIVGEGGVYKVIYTAPSGCKVESEIAVPLSIESLMWVFPTGCYDYCRAKERYVLGPKGTFDYHQWELFGTSLQNGTNDIIYPFYNINSPGTYRLKIEQNMPSGQKCEFFSGPLNYYPGKDCGIETQCNFEVKITSFKWDGDHYNVHGIIINTGSQPAMFNISSFNGYGTYFPSMITIPAGGTYDMNTNPLTFYPNASFPGGNDVILFLGQDDCKFIGEPEIIGKSVFAKTGNTPSLTTDSTLKLMPNPAKDVVKVSYNTGNEKLLATQIKVFDTMGNVKFHKELKSSSGEVSVDVSNWLQSTYIVIVQAGEKSLQGKLIKN
ncbi:PKD domain-containing protein [Chryseobacterium jejuense]|uniref:PKD domain-containing protein n=1 Tax=Chryseobacterium jejuense TaxID=445960 RepID=UPI001AE528D8|nr:PKD domain-containing protein [Chryseobacterium jejuense]